MSDQTRYSPVHLSLVSSYSDPVLYVVSVGSSNSAGGELDFPSEQEEEAIYDRQHDRPSESTACTHYNPNDTRKEKEKRDTEGADGGAAGEG